MKLDPTQNYTIGDLYRPAMAIADPAEAKAYFSELVEWHIAKWNEPREKAISTQKTNLGYFAGYYSHEDRARVERLFECAHPIFGAIAENGEPTAEQAFAMGAALAGTEAK